VQVAALGSPGEGVCCFGWLLKWLEHGVHQGGINGGVVAQSRAKEGLDRLL
jgi:hypothetical protein